MITATEKDGALIFAVRVVARAARSELVGEHDGALKVRVAAPPVEGAANEELRRTLARAFNVAARNVEIISGQTSKTKQVSIHGGDPAILKRLAAL